MRKQEGVFAPWMWGVIVAGILLIAWAVVHSLHEQDKWEAWCHAQGGRVISDTNTVTVTTFNANGQPGIGTSTTTDYFCLNPQGGIIGMR